MNNENSKNNKRNYRFIQKPLFDVDTVDRNKKEFDLNNQTQSEEKNDITIIDDPELHLHLNDDVKKYLQDSIQKQVEEKVQKSLSQIQNELDNTTLELNTLVEVVKTIVNDSGWYEDDSTSGTKYILNSGLFSGTGGLNFNTSKNSQSDLVVKDKDGNMYFIQAKSNPNVKGVSIPKGDYDISKLSIEENTFEKYMKEHGINQTLLSVRTGISRSSLINIMKTPSNISLINARKIAIALNESVDILFPPLDVE
jgi:DNA-binding XRE family transcriptional regulator